jgi:hypothetical protein
MPARPAHSTRTVLAGIVLLGAAGLAVADAQVRPAVVELYTSEGCSSCPPADALLEELSHRADVVAIAFHVDYWDSGGWRDRFALPDSAKRQNRFAETLHLATVGTPQMIIEGRRSVFGMDAGAVSKALSEPRQDNVTVRAVVDGANLLVDLPQRAAHQAYDLYVVSYLPLAVTRIASGENEGLTLNEANVVRSIRRYDINGDAARQWKIAIDSFPKDATRALVLLQHAGQGAIAGAVVASVR